MVLRIRSVKPEYFFDENLADMPALCRIFYLGLKGAADRKGRLEDRPRMLKAMILPYDEADADEFLKYLSEYNNRFGQPYITRYKVNDTGYIQINNFLSEEIPGKYEPSSRIPSMEGLVEEVVDSLKIDQNLRREIYGRDSFECKYCGLDMKSEPRKICIDLVIPAMKSGSLTKKNIVTSCKRCHGRKGDRTPDEAGMTWPEGFGEKVAEKRVDGVVTPVSGTSDPRPTPVSNGQNDDADNGLSNIVQLKLSSGNNDTYNTVNGVQPPVNPTLTPRQRGVMGGEDTVVTRRDGVARGHDPVKTSENQGQPTDGLVKLIDNGTQPPLKTVTTGNNRGNGHKDEGIHTDFPPPLTGGKPPVNPPLTTGQRRCRQPSVGKERKGKERKGLSLKGENHALTGILGSFVEEQDVNVRERKIAVGGRSYKKQVRSKFDYQELEWLSKTNRDAELALTLAKHVKEFTKEDLSGKDFSMWIEDMRQMRESENRTHERMLEVINFAIKDSFWRKVTLSPSRLQKNFTEIASRLEAEKQDPKKIEETKNNKAVEKMNELREKCLKIHSEMEPGKDRDSFKFDFEMSYENCQGLKRILEEHDKGT
ncbi:MAG: HNH endonuclease [Nitrospinota bacterium]|nr:HNH endonuclease [Nitrospinota bacterium]